jgi:UV DNA damage endonuclease
MKIGYPCINYSIERIGGSTFRLKSYSVERLIETVSNNLQYLEKMLEFNEANGILFFRISSDLVPFASHPVCTYNWQAHFKSAFGSIGKYIKKTKMRINMHPDQFVLINSIDEGVFERSIAELKYHADVLDLLGLGQEAKIQIHVGGVYGDRAGSIERFIERYKKLPVELKRRLVIENDHVNYGLSDCLEIHRNSGVPILFDVFHHAVLNSGQSVPEAISECSKTWKKRDGILTVDYSSQKPGTRAGTHTEHIDVADFRKFLKASSGHDFDIMLEIKDKEKSAIKALYCKNNTQW